MAIVWLFIGTAYVIVLCLAMIVMLFVSMHTVVTGKSITFPEWVYKCIPCYFLSGGIFFILFCLNAFYSFLHFVMSH